MKAVILAAGKGSRLAPYSDIIPKPLMPIEKNPDGSFKPIIDKLIGQIRAAGVDDIAVIVNYKADLVMNHLKDGKDLGVRIVYAFQGELDGNAGAYYRVQHLMGNEDVIVTDCDNYLSDDSVFALMRASHESSGAAVTVGVCRVSNVRKFAIIKTDASGKPLDIFEKPDDEAEWGNLAKSGMMILSNAVALEDKSVSRTDKGEFTTTHIIRHCLQSGKKVGLFDIERGFNDIGTWEEYSPILKRNL